MKNMKSKSLTFTLSVLLVLGTLAISRAQNQINVQSQYVGTWRLTSAQYGGQVANVSSIGVTLKQVTPTQFTWLSYDPGTGKISRAGGGAYTLSGDTCKEQVQYGMGDDYEAVKGKEQALQIKVEGDKLYNRGRLSNGTEINEVWERVK